MKFQENENTAYIKKIEMVDCLSLKLKIHRSKVVNIIIMLLICLLSPKQSAWVWSSIFAAMLCVWGDYQIIPRLFQQNFHKQPLMHVQRKVFVQSWLSYIYDYFFFIKMRAPMSTNLIRPKHCLEGLSKNFDHHSTSTFFITHEYF